jgi:hypothetical protein
MLLTPSELIPPFHEPHKSPHAYFGEGCLQERYYQPASACKCQQVMVGLWAVETDSPFQPRGQNVSFSGFIRVFKPQPSAASALAVPLDPVAMPTYANDGDQP